MLPGTAGTAPVLIIPGSGPTDRDGNSPLGIRAASYRLLAEGLAARGIGSVRIDKRGMFGSAAAAADANAVTVADYAADVRTWVETIRAKTKAPCVWLLGHSEGGLMALAAAARAPQGVCGLVLVAAPGRKLGTVLREQLRANPANAPLLDEALGAIAKLEAGERVDAARLHPALMPLFAPPVQGFLISLMAQDPAALLARFDGPVLVVQGRRDLQVAAADAERLAAARSGVKLAMLDGVNHALKQVASDDRAANMATYADPDMPLAPGVVEAIASFLAAHGKVR
jgi:pimeloyl-ACP methyl ester carboxylesterase